MRGFFALSCAVIVFSGMARAQSAPAPSSTPGAKAANVAAPSPLPAPDAPADQQLSARQKMEASIAKQVAAVQVQAGGVPGDGFFTTGWISPPPTLPLAPGCESASQTEAEATIKDAAGAQHLNPALVSAVIRQESAFQSCAVSPKGAMGLMQLMPETADQFHVSDPFDVKQNIGAGAQYLKQLLGRYKGDLRLALAAYNAGPKKVDGDPPTEPDIPETRDYVNQILKTLNGAPAELPDTDK